MVKKIIKFREKLSKLILNGEKSTTWRLFDDKDISEDDELSLVVWETGEEFVKAKVTFVKENKFKDLNEEDWEGHERYASNEEMYKEFSIYYKQAVDENTVVKIIRFEII